MTSTPGGRLGACSTLWTTLSGCCNACSRLIPQANIYLYQLTVIADSVNTCPLPPIMQLHHPPLQSETTHAWQVNSPDRNVNQIRCSDILHHLLASTHPTVIINFDQLLASTEHLHVWLYTLTLLESQTLVHTVLPPKMDWLPFFQRVWLFVRIVCMFLCVMGTFVHIVCMIVCVLCASVACTVHVKCSVTCVAFV